jgi:predicted transport protein
MNVLTEKQLLEALALIESYILRRAICGYQTRGYWQIFASLAYDISETQPLDDLKVALARQHENYRFPSDVEFERQLKEADLYGLRVCRHLLEGLENYGWKEVSDTSNCTIEHIMPQNDRLRAEWREMLGANWKDVQKTWLHRLGNLTLTAYNSTVSDRPFNEKKTIEGGFSDSAARLNKFVREQPVWTDKEMKSRTDTLAKGALQLWRGLSVEQSLIDDANRREKRKLAARQDIGKIKMSPQARALLEELRIRVKALDSEILELAEAKSVSYHGPAFFLEVLPRRYKLTLLLALDFNEVDDPSGLAEDASERKFYVNARYEGGVKVSIWDVATIDKALPLIRQAHAASNE